jgi:hypothetical protein
MSESLSNEVINVENSLEGKQEEQNISKLLNETDKELEKDEDSEDEDEDSEDEDSEDEDKRKLNLSKFVDINYSKIINKRLQTPPEIVINYKGSDIKFIERKLKEFRYKLYKYNAIKDNDIAECIEYMNNVLDSNGFINYEHFLYECAHRITLNPIEESHKINGWDCRHTVMLYEWDNKKIVFYTSEYDNTYYHEIPYDRDNFDNKLSSFCDDEYNPEYNDDKLLNELYNNRYKGDYKEKDVLKLICYKPPTEKLENYINEHPKYYGDIDMAYFIFLLYNL